ncbi:GNAT family N-acetyltransferase [Aliiruegeria lutimaris]|uniref:Acetyltransferase (GNAT) family protein n=1 Tax=Aliiruegeria lutimaris TaxID=571298 RepID=A0A1G8T404_9RHOB|nr:GNAT family N-acetyltransferase [Aliiruegeria lutimaris]SDJ35420.1 Acetyltransferase (GNAT) family protein [Aliiruegeria lutimaris]
MPVEIEVTFCPVRSDLDRLKAGFREYELLAIPGLPPESEDRRFAAFARSDAGVIIGGIEANIYWDGVEIELLWVAAEHRGEGLGRQLLSQVEQAAIERGAGIAFLKTVGAGGFYESMGYEVYGVLEDRPKGTRLYHMKKRLHP